MKTGFSIAIACALLVAQAASAAEPRRLLTSYSVRAWDDWNGVPLGAVYAIAQDPDGYLWIGGSAGVRRFDGVRFSDAAALGFSLPEAPVFALRVSPDGALWIGFGDGHGVRVIRGGAVSGMPELTLRASVTELAPDVAGHMWAATDKGLFRFGTGWQEIPLAGGAVGQSVLRVAIGRDGRIRVGTRTGVQECDAAGIFHDMGIARSPISSMSEDADGRLWVSDPVAGFRLAASASRARTDLHGRGYFVFHDSNANLWVGTHGQGLWRVRHDQESADEIIEVATVETGLISNGIWEIAEDRDGNIWVGTNRGLHRLTPHTMTPLLEHGLVRAVAAAPDGGVWLGTPGGVMRLGGGGEAARRIPAAVSVDASSLSVDPTGTLWVASDRSIWRLGAERLYGPIVDGRRGIRSIAGDGRGGVWVVDADGQLQRWHDGRLTSVALGQDTTTSRVAFVHVDRELRLWIAFEDDPLLLMEPEGSARVVRASDGPTVSPPTAVSTIAEDRDGTIWMGTRRGLARYRDGRLAVLTTTSGVFAQSVRALVVDDLGFVWLGVGTSIARLDPAEFDRALADPTRPVKLREFDVSDGVAGVMVSSGNSGAARAADGRLFFVTGRGITMTDPRVVDERLHPPSSAVRILSVFADDERCGAAAVLPAGTSHLRIDYTVPTLTAPERARFRYRLEGFDHAWIDAGIRRQAFYTNLPSGRYRFLVQVQLPNQAWASEWTEWGFRIAPAFYESAWFYAACSVALVAAAGGVWRMRVQSLRRELAAVYGERMRLGREIHDTLLQSLAGLALQLDAVEHRLATAEQDAGPRHLARIRQQIENHVREVRQSIWDLRSRPPQPRVLGQALADCIRPLVPESVHLDVTVTGATRPCPEHVERELLRIAREAVINAVRHGKPRHIVVGLLIERRALRLTVQDDGCGFEPAARTAGDEAHYGLAAMKERATSVGGTCDVTSSAGEGARVEVVLPLRARWRWGR